MLISVQSAGVAPEVNLRITLARKNARDPPRHHKKSKTGVSVTPQRRLMSSKNLKRNHDGGNRVST